MLNKKIVAQIMILLLAFTVMLPIHSTYAASADNVLNTLISSTVPSTNSSSGSGILDKLFSVLFDQILGPVLNILGNNKSSTKAPVTITPMPTPSGGSESTGSIQDDGVLRGKVIVVDPGHGGSNPGAVGNSTREADNNLSVGLKLRDKLVKAGAKVIITRDSDRTVATEGSSLGEELQARVDMAENNHADMFVSVHTNSNPDSNIVGAMTFYPSGKSSKLALEVQDAMIKETKAVDKGTSSATFYVLRNTTMPSILVEMGFITNPQEAAQLSDNSYRNSMAQGIFNGIVKYFNNN